MKTVLEAIAERRPDWVEAVLNMLPPRGDYSEEIDLKLWREGCANSGAIAIYRRCYEDTAQVEEMLLDRLQGRNQCQQ